MPADREATAGRGTPARAAAAHGSARAGWHAITSRPGVRVPVFVAALAIAMSGLTSAAVLARLVFGLRLPAADLGLLASAQGAGSIAGGLPVGRLIARLGTTRVAALGSAVFAAGCLAQCLPSWPAMLGGSVLVGVGLPWTLIAGVTAVQSEVPDHLLGRAAATSGMLMFGPVAIAIPLGSAFVRLGGRPPLLAAAAVAVAAAAWARASRKPAGGAQPCG